MFSRNGILIVVALALLAVVCHAAMGSDTSDNDVSALAISINANGDETASIPDFDGDGTIGFGDFVIFAGVFGARQGDEKYEAKYDLNGDGEIGFSDFVIFAQNFGREAPSPVVAIPDPNLRTAIESALNKDSGASITQAEMATLDSLEASDADISVLTGLEYATNLTWLVLASNDITSVSVLEGLTNLAHLILSSNNIADLAGLVANTGLGTGDTVDLADNPLNVASQSTHIPALRERGVSVSFIPPAVAIPDANLRAVIETALDKDSNAPITEAEMATLDSLAASDAEITDLTGMNYAANLTYLSLNDNDIKDISALAKLTSLTRLWLSNNSIDDVSALSKLTNLTELWLWNNQIEDISPLSGLTNLTRLSLGRNNVTDVSALAGLTNLKTIILTGNDISDLAPLAANKGLGAGSTVDVTDNPLNAASESTYIPTLQARGVSVSFVPSPAVAIPDPNLRAAIAAALGKERAAPITHAEIKTLNRLEANDSGISDLTGLEFATNLSYLNLSSWPSDDLPDNNISDVSPLTGLTDLTTLLIGGNNVSDLSPLSKLTNLTELWLESNSISVVSHLSGLPDLKELSLSDNNISDVSPLTGLTDLTTLLIGGNNVSDLSPLSRLTNLTYLILNTNNIANISALAKLTNLDRLFLSQNSIEDISALSKLTNLIELWLEHNQIEDISALSGLTRLTYLTLNANNIMNISALAKLTSLTRLLLGNNSIEDISALSKLTNLIELWLGFNQIKDISALSDLTNLKMLILTDNDVSDLTPLASNTGLGSGDTVNLVRNPLDVASTNTDIPALRARGVYVSFDEVIDITEPQIHNDNMLVLPVADNLAALWTHSGNPPPLEEYVARFYKHFNDEFDFLIFLPNVLFHQLEPEAIHGAFYRQVKNHTNGIGVPIFADNSRWASAERLQGVVFHNYIDPSMFRGLLLHELMHQWGNYVVPITSFPYGAHWGFSTSGGYLDCYDISNWIDHGDGKYSAPDPIYFRSSEQYSPIELYLAGFIPPEDVPDFQVAEDGKWLPDERGDIVKDDNGYRMFTASGFKTYTIEDIIAKHGRRDPNHVQSQKDFRAAVILLIGEDYPATREILESLSDDVSWFSHAGRDESGPPVTNFYEATGGRATITMDGLSQFVRSSGSKIAVPISFGTPPPPVLDYWETGNGHEDVERTPRHIPAEAEQP